MFLYLMLKKHGDPKGFYSGGGDLSPGRKCAMELSLPSDLTSTLILLCYFSVIGSQMAPPSLNSMQNREENSLGWVRLTLSSCLSEGRYMVALNRAAHTEDKDKF